MKETCFELESSALLYHSMDMVLPVETALIDIAGLTKTFGGIHAVEDVSFSVHRGEIFSIIGPNGAGKTTIFNCISGLYLPDSGEIRFRGELLNAMKPAAIAARGVGRTFQNLELFSRMSTMDNIMTGRHLHMTTGIFRGAFLWGGGSSAAREERRHREEAEKIIELLGLESVRDSFVGELPYGKQKLVELARALAMEPELLLLDEPSAGMNSEEKQDLFFWIQDIRDEAGITIVMIEHDMNLVMEISDRVLAVNFGRPITTGLPGDTARHPEVLKAYLGEDVP
jgi:branched-chain amino acid transport system ATP-binding protein